MYRVSIDYFILNVSLFSIGVTKAKDGCNFCLSVQNTMAHDEDRANRCRKDHLERKSSPIESPENRIPTALGRKTITLI